MKTAPQYWIDSFKENQNRLYKVDLYRIPSTSRWRPNDEVFLIWDKSAQGYLEDNEDHPYVYLDSISEAIQAAWEHFIQQEEVRGLMELVYHKSRNEVYSGVHSWQKPPNFEGFYDDLNHQIHE